MNIEPEEEFICAIENGQPEITEQLISKGIDINTRNGEFLTRAVRKGQTKIVKQLLQAGADLAANEDEALKAAIELEQLDLAKLFLTKRDYKSKDPNLAFRAYSLTKDTEELERILEHEDYSQMEKDKELREACKFGRQETAELLLRHNANPKTATNYPLRISVDRNYKPITKLIMATYTTPELLDMDQQKVLPRKEIQEELRLRINRQLQNKKKDEPTIEI